MDAFWCIVLSFFTLRWFIKSEREKRGLRRPRNPIASDEPVIHTEFDEELQAIRKRREADDQRERDIMELKKQGYTDELIAVILPTINNGQ